MSFSTPSLAQSDDVVVMRRVLAQSKRVLHPVEGAETSRAYWAATAWNMGPASCRTDAKGTRSVACVSEGRQVSDSECQGDKPSSSITSPDYRTCEFEWRSEVAGPWDKSCGFASRPLSSSCVRKGSQEVFQDDSCIGERPVSETGFNAESCGYQWLAGDWGEWADACSDRTSRSRQVTCVRSDGVIASESSCTGPKPDLVESGGNHAGCLNEYSWSPTPWTFPVPGCGPEVGRTRTLSCVDSEGKSVESSLCAGLQMPVTEGVGENYDACGFEWRTGDWGAWSSQCSTASRRTRDVSCYRSDGSAVDPNNCLESKPSESETEENLSNCTFGWNVGTWSEVKSCSATTERTREVVCRRSDGAAVDDGACISDGSKPPVSEIVADYSGCKYDWEVGAFTWSSSCAIAATGSRSVVCIRDDGKNTPMADSMCDAVTRPSSTAVEDRFDGCSASWSTGEWSDWDSTCSPSATRSRQVSCSRHLPNGVDEPVGTEKCDVTTRPSASESSRIFTSCTASWQYGNWGWLSVDGAKSSTCSAAPQQTRTAECRKIDQTGALVSVAESECASTPKQPVTQNLSSDYSGCRFEWSPNDDTSGWSAWSSACSANATRTRTIQCRRSDGLLFNDSSCNSATRPADSQTSAIYTACANVIVNPGFENGVKSGWVVPYGATSSSSDAYSGSLAASIAGNSPLRSSSFSAVKGDYGLSAMCKGGGSLNVIFEVAGSRRSSTVSCGSSWTLITKTYNIASNASVVLEFNVNSGGRTILVDEVSVQQN